MISFSNLPEIINGKIVEMYDDLPVEFLLTDSRKIISPSNSLFFAIKGERRNGHLFIEEAYSAGIRQFVIEEYDPKLGVYTGANFLKVKNSIVALQTLVAYKRTKFTFPIIGITGSNAKTIVKEWLAQLLSNSYSVVKSPKSYNSQIGVPLSVWQMNERHSLGIFEAGISKPGEMENLEKIILPDLGIFTNIGSAHNEGFADKNQKIAEKLRLFKNVKRLIFCKDHHDILKEVERSGIPSFSWSMHEKADLEVRQEKETKPNRYTFKYAEENIFKEFELELPFSDTASVEDLIHCIAMLLFLEVSSEEIQKRITSLKKVSMRLELKQGINNCYIIDDTYNNDLAGLTIALDFLNQQNQKANKTIILSDLYETGMDEKTLYKNIASLLHDKGITKFIGVGGELSANRNLFNMESHFYLSTKNLLNAFKLLFFSNEIILIKGSRIFEFERIVKQLQSKSHRTVLEVNLDAISNNLNFYRSCLRPETKIMVMVKSFAYGSGSLEVAQLLQFHRADYLAVAYADEGILLRENGITIPIMVMNPAPETFDLMISNQLEPVVYSLETLVLLNEFLEDNFATLKIHLEIESGMNRLGIEKSDVKSAIKLIHDSGKISVVSVFSHLAGADEGQFDEFTQIQYGILVSCATLIENGLKCKVIKHILNSAGIIRYPEFQLDMVRLGIGLYGVEVNGLFQNNLETVGTLKTTISQIKYVNRGETIGYSRKGKAERDTTIGIIAIGYGDGYNRAFSNGVGKVMVKGNLVPIIGNVCMDMAMIDITDIETEEGDEVIIFGKELSIIELAKSINTIPYEILTNVSERVKRVFYTE